MHRASDVHASGLSIDSRDPTFPHSAPDQGQSNVFARLQSLLPSTSTSPPDSGGAVPQNDAASPQHPHPGLSLPRFLKIRILTWNMNDTMPRGDLEELLGTVDRDLALPASTDENTFPELPSDVNHPYHLVVIASQECPSVSGIPRGLGAGLKIGEKERDKEKQKEKDKDKDKEKDRDSEKDNTKETDKEVYGLHSKNQLDPLEQDDVPKVRDSLEENPAEIPSSASSGWTYTVEGWLCHGGIQPNHSPHIPMIHHKYSSPDIQKRGVENMRRGPYQLLAKERMMGIYLAIYILSPLVPFVKGVSKDTVTAGLWKGRVGNKGAVGISMNIDGKTFLFVNAHLAAHEDKVRTRLANLAKIKAELSVDDYLDQDDPRVMAEDLTDKFDYTFFCGDLNFRLDISRLHADWLISRQDYAQALAFDQLRNLMQNGEAFVGFQEAPINFPPTFKYDRMPNLRHRKSKKVAHHIYSSGEEEPRSRPVSPNEDDVIKEEEHVLGYGNANCNNIDEGGEDDDQGESSSVVSSSARTSLRSRITTEDEDYFSDAPPSPKNHRPISFLGRNKSITKAANKARARWHALVPASPLRTPRTWLHGKLDVYETHIATPRLEVPSSLPEVRQEAMTDYPTPRSAPLFASVSSVQVASTIGAVTSNNPSEPETTGEYKGVYDSSHKKRVPSWCDRILWKSTVKPDLEPPAQEEQSTLFNFYRPNRVGQFFAQAFRHRPRREGHLQSLSPDLSSPEPTCPSPNLALTGLINLDNLPENESPTSYVPPEGMKLPTPQSLRPIRSSEELPVSERPLVFRRASLKANFHIDNSVHLTTPVHPSLSPASVTTSGSPSAEPPHLDNHHPVSHSRRSIDLHVPQAIRWISNFMSRDNTRVTEERNDGVPGPRKGDIVCLHYDTLDDKAMLRLESRSDHRPVIGSYAVYL